MLDTDWDSNSPPMKTCTATAETFMRIASSMLTAICSLDSSLRMLGPPLARMTIALGEAGGITLRRIPRVSIRASAKGASGRMEMSTRSRPVVGP